MRIFQKIFLPQNKHLEIHVHEPFEVLCECVTEKSSVDVSSTHLDPLTHTAAEDAY